MYLVVGVVAIVAGAFYMTIEMSIFEWAIVIMGVVAIYRGIKGLRALRNQDKS